MLDGMNKFSVNPVNLDIQRSTFDLSHQYKTTLESGDLVPIDWQEVLPGDTFKVNLSLVVRMMTPAVPVMDNCFIDVFFFFVPNRLSCGYHGNSSPSNINDWKAIMGENNYGYWASNEIKVVPSYYLSGRTVSPGSLLNYLGLPLGTYSSLQVSSLPISAFTMVYNEWFRDQNTQAPVGYDMTSENPTTSGDSYAYKVNKFHDYFTSCLPAPQKGDSVSLPLGDSAPVTVTVGSTTLNTSLGYNAFGSNEPLKFKSSQQLVPGATSAYPLHMINPGTSTTDTGFVQGGTAASGLGNTGYIRGTNLITNAGAQGSGEADLSSATASSVNSLRQAFAIQRMLEKDARGGTRYTEILKSHFGVNCPDYTLQRPEYLGGKRIPIRMDQVLQTSSTISSGTDASPLGYTGAFSLTSDSGTGFVKSFTEHGIILTCVAIRPMQSYCQGVNRAWFRKERFDFYWPSFANLGEQAVLNREIYFNLLDVTHNDEVFGYQEAWADYRYKPSLNTGLLAPNSSDTSLSRWTYSNDFSALPVLNSSFMKQSKDNIGQTLAATNNNTQFILDSFFDVKATRPMPLYSVPGLIDHH